MNDGTNLPEKDRDAELARRIGERLDEGRLESGKLVNDDDPFVSALMAWRRSAVARQAEPSREAANRLWQRIEDEMQDLPEREVLPERADRPVRPDRSARRDPRVRRDDSIRPGRPAVKQLVLRTPHWARASLAAALLVGGLVAVLVLRGPSAELVARADADVVQFTAPDGSIVMLRPHSDLYLVEETDEYVRYRLDGEGLFAVTERTEGSFAVEAGEALVEVVGTRFNVSTWGEATAVYLEEGTIRFSHPSTGAEVVLEPGESSRLTPSGELIDAVSESPDEHLDWLRGELQFEQRPVHLIAAELEQHFGVDLEIPQPIHDVTLTGRILLDESTQSLEDFATVVGGRFVESGPNAYRFESE